MRTRHHASGQIVGDLSRLAGRGRLRPGVSLVESRKVAPLRSVTGPTNGRRQANRGITPPATPPAIRRTAATSSATGTKPGHQATSDFPASEARASSGNHSVATQQPDAAHLLTLQQVADYLSISTKTVRRLIRAGRLLGYRVGGSGPYRFRLEEVDRCLVPICDPGLDDDLDDFITDMTGSQRG